MNKLKPSMSTDQELLHQTGLGDQDAIKELYDRYNIQVFNYLIRLLRKREIAEDTLQETFLAIWKGARSFKGKSTVKTWLFGIAHKQAVNWIRRNIKGGIPREINIPDSDIKIKVHETISLEEKTIGKWEIQQLLNALNQLSPNHRAVVELTYIQNFSYSEIAKIMGCPIGTVKSRMSYALRHLNRELTRQGVAIIDE